MASRNITLRYNTMRQESAESVEWLIYKASVEQKLVWIHDSLNNLRQEQETRLKPSFDSLVVRHQTRQMI